MEDGMSDHFLIPAQYRLGTLSHCLTKLSAGDNKKKSIKIHGNSAMIHFAVQLYWVCSDFHPSVSSFILSPKLKHLQCEQECVSRAGA